MSSKIQDIVLEITRNNPLLSNDEIAGIIRKQIPEARTTAASVSSIKSIAKRNKINTLAEHTPIYTYNQNKQEFNLDTFILANISNFSKSIHNNGLGYTTEPVPDTIITREHRIRNRHTVLTRIMGKIAKSQLPALVVSGPPGLGKSYTIEQVLTTNELTDINLLEEEEIEAHIANNITLYDIVRGTITAPGLYHSLWRLRNKGILVLDDCDDVFKDETSLNILKTVLDSNPIRRISYRKRAAWLDMLNIPSSFIFSGAVVFCTNLDFEVLISRGSALTPHFSALIDRSLYLQLTMRTKEDFLTKLYQIGIEENMLVNLGLTSEQALEIMIFVEKHIDRFYTLSLRLLVHIAICFISDPMNWESDIEATKMRTI